MRDNGPTRIKVGMVDSTVQEQAEETSTVKADPNRGVRDDNTPAPIERACMMMMRRSNTS